MRRPGVLFGVLASGALVAGVLIAASLAGGRDPSSAVAPSTRSAALGSSETAALLRGIPQDGIALGSPDAPVTLVEYADLQCPYCAQWALDAFPTIVDEYVRTGRVRLVFRGLAFIGPDSDRALRAALAAGGQNRLWNVIHLLYRNQGAENGGWVTSDLLERIAGSVTGLDGDRMLAGTSSVRVERELAAAQRAATAAGISGTPSFTAGPTDGAQEPIALTSLGPEEIAARLDALLAE